MQGVAQLTIFTKGFGVGGKIELRVGSPEGTLLGETRFPGKDDKEKNVPLKLTAAAPPGKQDIYLVFRNPDAKGNFLGGVEKLEFLSE
nr:hypothetical protein [Haliscomenobacter sp.]